MFIEFTKDHTSGIKAGTVAEYPESSAERMIKAGLAKESTEEAFEKFVEVSRKANKEKAKADLAKAKEELARREALAKLPKPATGEALIKELRAEIAELKAEIAKLKKPTKETTKK